MNFNKYHVSRNLFDKAWLNNDRQLSPSTGIPAEYTGRLATINPINVSDIDSVVLTYSLGSSVSEYFMYSIFSGNTLIERVANKVSGDAINVSNADKLYIGLYIGDRNITVNDVQWIMLNTGSTPIPYEPYGNSWTNIPHYIHNTATDTITTLPADIYANDTTATVGLKGNMSQTGTPTPQNPIQPRETGDRTVQLFDKTATNTDNGYNDAGYLTQAGALAQSSAYFVSEYIKVNPNTDYTLVYHTSDVNTPSVCFYDENKDYIGGTSYGRTLPITFTTPNNTAYIRFSGVDASKNIIMLNTGSTALPYEPYGYKIPILSANITTPVYLGEVQTTRKIKKYEFTGQENDWKVESGRFYNDNAVTDYMLNISDYAYCTHFNVIEQQTSASPVHDGDICFRNGNPRVYIYNGNYETVTDFATWLAQQYANGTPVTVWYVLATETTGIVNEPLMKIGDYADTVSGITIPTIAGANSFDVLTTLKPSEVTANYHGWHTGAVHERDSGAWT